MLKTKQFVLSVIEQCRLCIKGIFFVSILYEYIAIPDGVLIKLQCVCVYNTQGVYTAPRVCRRLRENNWANAKQGPELKSAANIHKLGRILPWGWGRRGGQAGVRACVHGGVGGLQLGWDLGIVAWSTLPDGMVEQNRKEITRAANWSLFFYVKGNSADLSIKHSIVGIGRSSCCSLARVCLVWAIGL